VKDPILKKVYNLLFPGSRGKGPTLKKHIRLFSGFPQGGEEKEELVSSLETKMNKWKNTDLKQIAHIFDLEVGGAKEKIVERIVAFLFKPESSGRSYKKRKSPSSSSSSKGKKKKETKKKGTRSNTGPSGYLLWSNDNRERIKKDNKDAKPVDLMRILAAEWQSLSDKEKEKWKKQSRDLKGKKEKKRARR